MFYTAASVLGGDSPPDRHCQSHTSKTCARNTPRLSLKERTPCNTTVKYVLVKKEQIDYGCSRTLLTSQNGSNGLLGAQVEGSSIVSL